jgi:hypothetical protein
MMAQDQQEQLATEETRLAEAARALRLTHALTLSHGRRGRLRRVLKVIDDKRRRREAAERQRGGAAT